MSDKGKLRKSGGKSGTPEMTTSSDTKKNTANLQNNKRHMDNINN